MIIPPCKKEKAWDQATKELFDQILQRTMHCLVDLLPHIQEDSE